MKQNADSAHPINMKQSPESGPPTEPFGGRQENLQQRRDLLAARLMAGDRQAATELVDLYYRQIYLYMRRLGHSRQVGEDLTQEIFLQTWDHLWQLRDGRSLNNWLYRIAGNVSNQYWRRHGGSKPASLDGIDVAADSEPEADKAGHYEQLALLKDAVARLPMKLKQPVVLHYMQHLTIVEAAEAAGMRESTFKSRLNRALKVLRKHFTQKGL
jgi:RNA polymerase sigma-70 factor (ECF subfamily)